MDGSKEIVRVLTVAFPVRVAVEDIDDIMVSALEGGICYWADEARVDELRRKSEWGHEQIARGGMLAIHVTEPFEDGKEWYVLTLDKFLRALNRWLENNPDSLVPENDWYRIDCGQVDAVGADNIVQLALFGEVVFG